jgi:LmbE family N-acetylglucosaminyl deacetylase
MSNRRLVRRLAVGTATVLLAAAGSACGAFYYNIYRANAAVQRVSLPAQPAAARGARILVIAPHCDDETLGVGGYMAQAARAGSQVRVVLITNGDGFPLAASRQYWRLSPSPENYLNLAHLRQDETRSALQALGLPASAATFLGYPDGGLSLMWSKHWSRSAPYTSRFTRFSSSPYSNSYRPHAPYAGESVLRDLKEILEQERPTSLFLPDPGDDHPDHWAAYCFAVTALESIRCAGTAGDRWAANVDVRTYLIHRGDWPVPQGSREEARLVPPDSLLHLDTRWNEATLSPEDRQKKREAVHRYRSQMAVMSRFLSSFIRQDELFGTLPPANLTPLAAPHLAASGMPADWRAGSAHLVDAREDTFIRRFEPAADLVSLDALADDMRLYLRLSARARLLDGIEYRLYLHPIGEVAGAGPPVAILLHDPAGYPDGIRSQTRDNQWQISIPLKRLGSPRRVLVGAETRLGQVAFDRLSWRVLVLPRGGLVAQPLTARPAGEGRRGMRADLRQVAARWRPARRAPTGPNPGAK